MSPLHIYDRRERALVRTADLMLQPIGLLQRPFRRTRLGGAPHRILCLRLERIGDLLMTLPALAELRALAPSADIDLVVGSWNRELASSVSGINRVDVLDAAWLGRQGAGDAMPALLRHAWGWRARHYDLALNFEPDIRTNLLLAASGARTLIGFGSGGGGPLLDVAVDFDPRSHNADNAVRLVRRALGAPAGATPAGRLDIPPDAEEKAAALVAPFTGSLLVGVHVSGGRAVKQWPEDRFVEIASRLVTERQAAVVLTGSPADREQLARVTAGLPRDRVLDISGQDLLTVAGVLRRLHLFVTGDTGPMHLAQAVGTAIVAIFGPSDPARYAPRGPRDRIVRVDLPCSPCNRIRLPPARCTGHAPDCLAFVHAAQVWAAIADALEDRPWREQSPAEISRS